MRIVFMGTPDFSVPPLAKILESKHQVIAVYSQPPRPAGRGMTERKSPVHAFAQNAGIPVYTPLNFKDPSDQQAFVSHNADAAVVIAYGLILPKAILNAPPLGCYNLHASKLPRWRGAAPIQRAIMAGDTQTAAIIMRMEEGLDTGPICMSRPIDIPADMTAGQLHDELSNQGADLIVQLLDALEQNTIRETPQDDHGITYAAKIEKAEAKIDFSKSARDVHNLIRGLSPFPGAWFEAQKGDKKERIKALRSRQVEGRGIPGEILAHDHALVIACGEGAIALDLVQRAGKKPAPVQEFLRGFKLEPGTIVGR